MQPAPLINKGLFGLIQMGRSLGEFDRVEGHFVEQLAFFDDAIGRAQGVHDQFSIGLHVVEALPQLVHHLGLVLDEFRRGFGFAGCFAKLAVFAGEGGKVCERGAGAVGEDEGGGEEDEEK